MFAPTVTGSPIENACRVIARHERRGRGYYAGVLALLGHDDGGRQTLDAPILIRTAEISADGALRVPVGATLVRHSTAAGEVAETHAKAAGILTALGLRPGPDARRAPVPRLADDPRVRPRWPPATTDLARFWLDAAGPGRAGPAGAGRPPRGDRRRRGHLHRDARPPASRARACAVTVLPWTAPACRRRRPRGRRSRPGRPGRPDRRRRWRRCAAWSTALLADGRPTAGGLPRPPGAGRRARARHCTAGTRPTRACSGWSTCSAPPAGWASTRASPRPRRADRWPPPTVRSSWPATRPTARCTRCAGPLRRRAVPPGVGAQRRRAAALTGLLLHVLAPVASA